MPQRKRKHDDDEDDENDENSMQDTSKTHVLANRDKNCLKIVHTIVKGLLPRPIQTVHHQL